MVFLRRARHVASILSLILFVACASLEPRPDQPTPSADTNQPSTQDDADPFSGEAEPPTTTANPDNPKQETPRWYSFLGSEITPQWIEALATVGGIVAAIWAGKLALRTLRTQTTQIRIERSALTASRKSADAAVASAKTAELHMYLALRARMAFRKVRPENFSTGARTYFVVDFRNAGGKGATLIDHALVVNIGPIVPTPNYQLGITVPLGTPCEAGESHELNIRMTPPMSQAEWDAINDETKPDKLVVYGTLRYDAGFGQGIKTLAFGQQYDPVQSRLEGAPVFTGFGGQSYNHAD